MPAEPFKVPVRWYVGAVLIPILGVVLAIVALAKGAVGPGLALGLTSALAWMAALVMFGL
jgi:hypothetical protein